MVAARELTKKFEEVVRGPAGEVLAHFREHRPQGEFVLIVAGAGPEDTAPAPPPRAEPPEEAVAARVAAGASERDAVRAVATERGLARREVYAAWVRLKGSAE